jgi:hypothetical protein
MDFEEMQKVWDEQKGETMYVINESALHKTVTRKKDAAGRRINRVEIALSIINSIVLIFILIRMFYHPHIWGFISAGILVISLVYVQYFRWKRKRAEDAFDRSMLGELDHAISNAGFMIRFNYLMFAGYYIPIFVVAFSSLIVKGAPLQKWTLITILFLLGFLVIRWEQKACNIPRKKQLMTLRKKLTEE